MNTFITNTAEYKRLLEADKNNPEYNPNKNWRRWGPYLSNRQWGTVREDCSADGNTWSALPYEKSRSTSYCWGEDGIFGISDDRQELCFALALWNGKDSHIKERFFGVPGLFGHYQGNHFEDVKEYYFYVANTPTHSYMEALYKYPHDAFPYDELNKQQGRDQTKPEYELIDTEIFNKNRYFDITVKYAKGDNPDDILIQIEIQNQCEEKHGLHIIPMLWIKNNGLSGDKEGDVSSLIKNDNYILAKWGGSNSHLNAMRLYFESQDAVLITNNKTNPSNSDDNAYEHYKDGINNYLVNKYPPEKNNNQDKDFDRFITNDQEGTKIGVHYYCKDTGKELKTIKLRLTPKELSSPLEFDELLNTRLNECYDFYNAISPKIHNKELRLIQRQAFAGMLWSKQYYYYDVNKWLEHQRNNNPINTDWKNFKVEGIISMPDKWEYPYFATWDTAFHVATFALIDALFAKEQLLLMTSQNNFMSDKGQIPGCEFEFSNNNPPRMCVGRLKNL